MALAAVLEWQRCSVQQAEVEGAEPSGGRYGQRCDDGDAAVRGQSSSASAGFSSMSSNNSSNASSNGSYKAAAGAAVVVRPSAGHWE